MATKPTQLPSGNWRSIANFGKGPDGKQRRKSFTASTKKEAYRLACEAEFDHADQVADTLHPEASYTVGDAIDGFIALKAPVLSPSTVLGYRAVRRAQLQGIMHLRLCDLTNSIIQQEISRESLTKSPKTVRNSYSLLAAVLKQYRPDFRPDVRLPQKKKEEIRIPSLSEIEQLIKAADDAGDADTALAIMFAAQLGLRRSEICALTFADIKDKSLVINKAVVRDENMAYHTKAPKTNAGYRTLPLTDQLLRRLADRAGAPEDFIVPLRPDLITRHFEKLQKDLNVPQPYRFHDLRHYNASVMISLGIPSLYITRRLGHSSDDMVKRVYGHLIGDKQDDVNRQLNEYFA